MDSELLKKLLDDIADLKKAINTNQKTKEWFTVHEASSYLGVSVNTLYKYVCESKVPYKKMPGSNLLRFRKRSLDVWLETGKKLN